VVTRANNDEGTLSLQYGVAALIASITIARKVVDHDKQIKELERQLSEANERIVSLEDEVKQLKAA
jgi:predicted RNase H-like nuclease (RuvC/YqgF family)